MPVSTWRYWRGCSILCRGDDPGSVRRAGVDLGRSHGHALRHELVGLAHPAGAAARPHAGDLYVFRGKSGKLVKIFWYDGLGASLYANRLEKGRFVWPATHDGVVTITPGQLGYLLEGIDWCHPQHTWRPEVAG